MCGSRPDPPPCILARSFRRPLHHKYIYIIDIPDFDLPGPQGLVCSNFANQTSCNSAVELTGGRKLPIQVFGPINIRAIVEGPARRPRSGVLGLFVLLLGIVYLSQGCGRRRLYIFNSKDRRGIKLRDGSVPGHVVGWPPHL